MEIPREIQGLIELGALFVINDSAGKDSQAMKIKLMEIIPHNQLVIVHANLPEVEWEGNMEHIQKYSGNIPVYEVQANKTFFEMVAHRGKFPSPKYRQCTSDLKRGPLQKLIRNYAKKHGFRYVVNCTGIRAQESAARKKKKPFEYKPKLSAKHRAWYEWMPIFNMLLEEVWDTIRNAGQLPHYAYGLGMKRLSCVICIMACDSDIKIGAKHNPKLAQRYIEEEERLNFTLSMSQRPLKEIINS